MLDFFFAGWPHGIGPALVQITLVLLGSAAGIRIFDDATRVVAARRSRRSL